MLAAINVLVVSLHSFSGSTSSWAVYGSSSTPGTLPGRWSSGRPCNPYSLRTKICRSSNKVMSYESCLIFCCILCSSFISESLFSMPINVGPCVWIHSALQLPMSISNHLYLILFGSSSKYLWVTLA
ncbi:hypothetical protein C8R45DRAFT_121910 [Mycena sanguinolenta]|nr:hypothetical protein C8R45DRAFT_121910 [Mycena sanguinolenta]